MSVGNRADPIKPHLTATEAAATYQALAYLELIFATAEKPLPNARQITNTKAELARRLEERGFVLVEDTWQAPG